MYDVPAQNRVSPLAEVISAAGRGAWMGNRGRLHEGSGTRRVVRTYQMRAWITCRLEFRGWLAAQWEPGHYTPLFFLDEAVALAAGHRPCAECRRADFVTFRDLAADALGVDSLRAAELDRVLHEQRWDKIVRQHRLHDAPWAQLPDGVFVILYDAPMLVCGEHLTPWLPDNSYGPPIARPAGGSASVITPPLTVAVLQAGYPAQIDG